ncbi:hypothetical protein ACVJGB_008933 [Bradyrhizobium liaoningense]
MFDPFSQQGAGELNVLKRHLQSTVLTLLDRNTSQREIHRLTGVDRKTIRRYQALRAGAEANSPGEVTTGSVSADGPNSSTPTTGFCPAGHFKFLRVWSVKFLHPRGRTRDC